MGQLIIYADEYPLHVKRLHLFDIEYNENINLVCKKHNIIVSHESGHWYKQK